MFYACNSNLSTPATVEQRQQSMCMWADGCPYCSRAGEQGACQWRGQVHLRHRRSAGAVGQCICCTTSVLCCQHCWEISKAAGRTGNTGHWSKYVTREMVQQQFPSMQSASIGKLYLDCRAWVRQVCFMAVEGEHTARQHQICVVHSCRGSGEDAHCKQHLAGKSGTAGKTTKLGTTMKGASRI